MILAYVVIAGISYIKKSCFKEKSKHERIFYKFHIEYVIIYQKIKEANINLLASLIRYLEKLSFNKFHQFFIKFIFLIIERCMTAILEWHKL